jgi:hypothetical protein
MFRGQHQGCSRCKIIRATKTVATVKRRKAILTLLRMAELFNEDYDSLIEEVTFENRNG